MYRHSKPFWRHAVMSSHTNSNSSVPFRVPRVPTRTRLNSHHHCKFSARRENFPNLFFFCSASKLQSLKLPFCELDLDGLSMFLSVTPNLETLCYDRLCDLDPREPSKGPSRVYDLNKLGRALISVRGTLKHLSLSISYYASTAMEPDYPNETCCVISSPFSFQQFQKLEYLEISFVVIFGYPQTSMASYSPHNLLPSSLRHLFLRDDLANCVDYEWEAPACLARLGELIPNCVGPDKLLSALKYLTLRVRNGFHEDWNESHQDELRSMCTSAGLSCSISKKIDTS